MEPEFVTALTAWFLSLMREEQGPGEDGHAYDTWLPEEWIDTLSRHAPSTVDGFQKAMVYVPCNAQGYREVDDVWKHMSDKDVGIIMKVGAASYIHTAPTISKELEVV